MKSATFESSLIKALRCGLIVMGAGLGPSAIAETSAAQTPTVPASQERSQAAVKSNYSNKLICKREYQMGSMIPKRICRTQAKIDADRAASQEFGDSVNAVQGRNGGGTDQ